MHRAFQWNGRIVTTSVAFLDLLTVGMGMGVPFFTILLGFPLGWYFAHRAELSGDSAEKALHRAFRWSGLTVLFTFAVLSILWVPAVTMLFDPAADLANFGIPMILYTPTASFIGWMVLMLIVSPILQGLAALSTAYVTFMRLWKARA